MGWEHLARSLEQYLPENEGYEWLFKEERCRIKLFKDNWHYGVEGSLKDGENQIKPIVVLKCLANPQVTSAGNAVSLDQWEKVLTDAKKACEVYYNDPNAWKVKA